MKRQSGSRRDRGSLGPMLVMLVVTLFLFVGLVTDGGALLAGKREAHDVAAQASLAGAQALDTAALLRGDALPALDPVLATSRANAVLALAGLSGEVSAGATEVRVTVHVPVAMSFLGTLGVPDRTLTGTASARPVRGVVSSET